MKSTLIIFITLLFFQPAWSQTENKYQQALKNALGIMKEAKEGEDFIKAANAFERIASVEKDKWEPLYYLGFIKTIGAFNAADKTAAGEELQSLTTRLNEALEFTDVKSNNKAQSEIHALIAMMYSARMMANPMALGSQLAPLNQQHLDLAITSNANNPRAYLLQAQNLFYTPEAFGGDKKRAKLLAQKAMDLFNEEANQQDSDDDFMPTWGKDQAENLIK